MDRNISGIGASGLLESRALKDAEKRLMDFIVEVGQTNLKLGRRVHLRPTSSSIPGKVPSV